MLPIRGLTQSSAARRLWRVRRSDLLSTALFDVPSNRLCQRERFQIDVRTTEIVIDAQFGNGHAVRSDGLRKVGQAIIRSVHLEA